MDTFDFMEEWAPAIQAGDVTSVRTRVEEALRGLPSSPFQQALELDFTNPPAEVAAYVDAFLTEQKAALSVEAVYVEMNGFSINPDLWFFNAFAFSGYGGHDDYDWLSDWESSDDDGFTLTGMESLQDVYASDAFDKEDEAIDWCDFLVLCKFQELIKKSVPLMRQLSCPFLATAHDYDFIAEFRKR